jgi:protein-disulfide isomerase
MLRRRAVTAALSLSGLAALAGFSPLRLFPSAMAQGASDVAKPVSLPDMALGAANAPVTIVEYAAATCPHCGRFGRDVFPKIKAAYIDTGKVFYTYTDIPLNAPALEAAMVARCMPAEHYFDFIKILFTTQDKWAFNDKYETSLRQSSKLLGMSDETFDACVGNQDLKLAIVNRMDELGKANHIDSTPSFIINGKLIHGALPFSDFQKNIDPLLNKGALKK